MIVKREYMARFIVKFIISIVIIILTRLKAMGNLIFLYLLFPKRQLLTASFRIFAAIAEKHWKGLLISSE